MERLGIYIVSWNRLEFLQRTVASLLDHLDRPTPITIIDNCSDAPTRQWLSTLQATFPAVRPLFLSENRWVNGAHESAWPADISQAFHYVLCCDNDVEFFKPVGPLIDFLDQHSEFSTLSLQHSPEHPVVKYMNEAVPLKQYERGTAVIYRSAFLQANRPLPIHRNLDFDWWLFRDGPSSVAARGELVPVIPSVRHLAWKLGDSTWQNIEIPEFPVFKECCTDSSQRGNHS